MFKTGDTICDRYRILDRPFAGGMAKVYPAEDLVTHDKVALKMLKELDNPEAVERFEREVIALTELKHPNIVRMLGKAVYPWAQNQTMTICVLEWIDGGMSLEPLCYEYGCNLPLPLMLSLMYQVADAIAYAHGKEIIHRDIKPSNILLDLGSDGEMIAKVADFGTVKLRESPTKLTELGETLGTPLYMSPEQGLAPIKPIEFPPSVDVFSFWGMVYELLTNRRPYMHKCQPVPENYPQHVEPWKQIQSGTLTLEPIATFNPNVPASLQVMIHQGLDREPTARPSMAEAAILLRQLWEELSEEDKADASRHVVVPSSYPPNPSPFAATVATPASLTRQKIAQAKEERRTLFGLGFPSQPSFAQAMATATGPQLVRRDLTTKSVATTASGQIKVSEVVAEANQAYAQPVVIAARQSSTPPQGPVPAPSMVQAPPVSARVSTSKRTTPKPPPQPEVQSGAAMYVVALLLVLAILGVVTAKHWLPMVRGDAQAVASNQAPVPTATVSQVAKEPEAPVVTASQPIPIRVRPNQPVAVPSRLPPGKGKPLTGRANDGFAVEGLPPGTPPPPDNP
ncbi:MAG: protein kinase [Patescibacteria group bacterium]|jgi:serine/threonine-protein kinase